MMKRRVVFWVGLLRASFEGEGGVGGGGVVWGMGV